MKATDRDIGVNQEIEYSFESGHNNDFTVNKDSGVVSVARNLNYGAKNYYRFRVKAMDKGNPRLSGYAFVTITVKGMSCVFLKLVYV